MSDAHSNVDPVRLTDVDLVRPADVDDVRRAQLALDDGLESLTDTEARRPSLLPGWTIGHVLTHIARNADGMRAMIEGAAVGEVRPQYPGGAEQRNDDIAAGADRPARELIADVRTAGSAFLEACSALPAEGWAGVGESFGGRVALVDVPWRRLREVSIHHVDLGLGYTWNDLPAAFVRAELRAQTMQWASRKPMGLTALPAEALAVPDPLRLAWLLGRAEIPGLDRIAGS